MSRTHSKNYEAELLVWKLKRGWFDPQTDPMILPPTCRKCHHQAPENRPSQALFKCVQCGHEDNADFNSAGVILDAGMEQAGKLNLLSSDGLAAVTREPAERKLGDVKSLQLALFAITNPEQWNESIPFTAGNPRHFCRRGSQ